jgi:hypothetical protein
VHVQAAAAHSNCSNSLPAHTALRRVASATASCCSTSVKDTNLQEEEEEEEVCICIYVYTIYIHAGGQRVAASARCVPLTCSSCSSKSPSPVAAEAAAMRSAWGEPSAARQYVLHATYAARATRCNATLSRCNSDVCRRAGDRHLVGGARCRLQRAQLRCCSADGK